VQPQIVHFAGEGAEAGILLEDEAGKSVALPAEALTSLFALFAREGVECVVLNAVYSESQVQAISQYVPYVIGMQQTISAHAATEFAVAFYDALGAGRTIEFAFKLGCAVLSEPDQAAPILRQGVLHPRATAAEAIAVIPPNPYQGLAAFQEADAAFLFGRDRFLWGDGDTEIGLVKAVQTQPLVGVIGSSGSGKSSVVFAGLLPVLRQQGWLIELMRPEQYPFYGLASALVSWLEPKLGRTEQVVKAKELAKVIEQDGFSEIISEICKDHSDQPLLLVIDQFEELYTLCRDEAEQHRFIDGLLDAIAAGQLSVVFTLRADFYGYALSYRPFRDALQRYPSQLISSMNREELQAAIEQPAEKMGVKLEAGLANRILDAVGNEPGNLPLLEFALTQLWEKQLHQTLSHQAYEAIGEVKQALANHAEEIYSRLNKEEKEQAQQIFVQLVQPSEDTEDTRRLVTRVEIGDARWNLITRPKGLADCRLVVTGRNEQTGEETVEVVHEALIREWQRLRQWIDSDRKKLLQKREIEAQAKRWKEEKELKDYLLQGKQLRDAKAFSKEKSGTLVLSDMAGSFVKKSVQRQWSDRFRAVGLGLVVPLGLAVFVGYEVQRQLEANQRQIVIQGYWETISSAQGQMDNAARISALQELSKLNISLDSIQLDGANLRGADLSKANLRGADLSHTDLYSTNIRGADLSKANLRGAYLSKANLKDANLSYANLRDVGFRGADLRGAQLSYANLKDVDLSGANLTNADLSGAILLNTDLSEAKELTLGQLAKDDLPLLCRVKLPQDLQGKVDRNRDCEKIPQLLVNQGEFPTIEEAKDYIDSLK
jgi:uncharacterized protein YjbI with pentapeptide repeats